MDGALNLITIIVGILAIAISVLLWGPWAGAIVLVLVVVLVVRAYRAGTPEGFASGVAFSRSHAFFAYRLKNPEMSDRELYVRVIRSYSGYEYRTEEVLTMTEACNSASAEPVKLWTVVATLGMLEYQRRIGRALTPVEIAKVLTVVQEKIRPHW